ncbi:MAG: hypothetical protein E7316_10535 [Clostridiales bacterium]|nr:hypothetical protein [Clostridiales bacterium]
MTTGLTPSTFENLQLNAGLFLRGFDFSSAASAAQLRLLVADAIAEGSCVIGATRGGGTFQCTPSLRSIEADGLRSPSIGSTVNDGWTVKLSGTMLEITPENFAAALICADVETSGSITTIRARSEITEEDYIPTLCWIGDTSRGFVLIELTNALNMKGAAFTFTDKGEGTLPFEFQAHQAAGEEDYAPFRVIFFD